MRVKVPSFWRIFSSPVRAAFRVLAPASGPVAVRLADVKALLEEFGEAKADTEVHPSAMIYDGQRMDGAARR